MNALFHWLFCSLGTLLKALVEICIRLDLVVLNRFGVLNACSYKGLGRFNDSSALGIELS